MVACKCHSCRLRRALGLFPFNALVSSSSFTAQASPQHIFVCLCLSSERVSSARGDQASARVSENQQQACRPAGTAHNSTVLGPGGEPCSREPLNCRKSLFVLEKRRPFGCCCKQGLSTKRDERLRRKP